MVSYAIILVEPKTGGNIGAIARSMANFELSELILVNPKDLGEEAYTRAMHAQNILDDAVIVESLEDASGLVDLMVATSSRTAHREKKSIRVPLSPEELFSRLKDYSGKVGLVFGREDYGLYNHELMKCDLLVTIPANPEYPVLNLSHAATVIFYELYKHGYEHMEKTEASPQEKERLFMFFDSLLDAIEWPEHKKERTSITFRRMVSRAMPTKWEFYTIAGVIKKARDIILNKHEKNH